MSQLLIPDVCDELLTRLQERALQNARTVEAEAREILTEALQLSQDDPWAEVDAIYNELKATGRDFGDSVQDIREDRER